MRAELAFLAALMGGVAGGCMMEVGEPGVDGVYEDEVALSGSALSLITTLSDISADRFHGLGAPFFAALSNDGAELCMPPRELLIMTFSPTPSSTNTCRVISNAANADGDFFWADHAADDIVALHDDEETKLADTDGNTRGRLALDATHVFWADSNGMHKIGRTGGAITHLSFDGTLNVLAVHGSTIYYSKPGLNNAHTLRRMSTAGGNSTAIITYTSTAGFKDFAVDGTAMYWVDNTQATNRLRRLSQAVGATMTTVVSDNENIYGLPTPGPHGMHFVEWNYDVGVIKIRRLLNGSISDQYQTLVDIVGMVQAGSRLNWAEDWPSYFRIRTATTTL